MNDPIQTEASRTDWHRRKMCAAAPDYGADPDNARDHDADPLRALDRCTCGGPAEILSVVPVVACRWCGLRGDGGTDIVGGWARAVARRKFLRAAIVAERAAAKC